MSCFVQSSCKTDRKLADDYGESLEEKTHGNWRKPSFNRSKVWNASRLAAEPGFEPGLRDSKSPVLPLHNSAFTYLVPKVGLEPT